MSIDKYFVLIGLFFAFWGAVFLSIDTLGKEKIYDNFSRWFQRFKKQKTTITLLVGAMVGVIAILYIDSWKAFVTEEFVSLMREAPVISISLSTIASLAIIVLIVFGENIRGAFIKIGRTNLAIYRVLLNIVTLKWLKYLINAFTKMSYSNLLRWNFRSLLKVLFKLITVITQIFLVLYFSILLIGSPIAYFITKEEVFWDISVTIQLAIIITFMLVAAGFPVVQVALSIFNFLIREDVDKTFNRFSATGFLLLALGFVLQFIGVIIRLPL
ncbi:hypothetical protein ACFLXG_03095 [Chloroflexota bacterium]